MDNKYLWKRKNRYWVRVRVRDKVRDMIGSVELCLNLYTSDLQEANVLKQGISISSFNGLGTLR